MPDISSAGTYTKDTAGYGFLRAQGGGRVLLFAGSSIGTSVDIQYTDDQGTDRTVENGSITVLPTSVYIRSLNQDLKIVVTGTPNFNVSSPN